jgi:elongation factor G
MPLSIYPFQVSLTFLRFNSSKLIRNIGIIAHVDAGKTSTTEKLILASGLIRRSGSVDSGDTVMDYLPEERERGITINSAAITIPWRGHQINIIDTPGHVDFTVEVERSLRVLDGVVVILDYTKGIQAQTLTVWRQAQRYNLPKIIFLNKIDKGGPNQKCLFEIEKQFGMKPVLLNKPVFLDGSIKSVNDASANDDAEIVESLCEYDQDLLENYIENEKVSLEQVFNSFRRTSNTIVPVLHGSASVGLGITSLLDAIVNILPSPLPAARSEFSALAFKTVFDSKRNGFLTYCRIYGGELNGKRSELFNVNRGKMETSVQLMQVMADELIPLQQAESGQIVVFTGLKGTATGDTLSTSKKTLPLQGIAIPSPVIGMSIEAESLSDQDRLDEALRIIQLEDPSVSVVLDSETGQTLLQGMGELHLEIVQNRLKNDLKASFNCGPIQIGYKEAIKDASLLNTTLMISKEIFGVKIIGEISLTLETGENFADLKIAYGDESTAKYLEDGILSAFSRGPIAGFAVERRGRVTVTKLNYNTAESCRTLAFEATKVLLQQAAIKVHEPIVSVDLELPEAHIGTITSDLFSSRSCIEFSELESNNELKRIRFTAPLHNMLGYSTWLRSQTSGTGSFAMQTCGYAECSKFNNKRAEKYA